MPPLQNLSNPKSHTFLVATIALLMLSSPSPSYLSLASHTPAQSTDQEALLAFKSLITDDPSGFLSTWNPAAGNSTAFCRWRGVTCNGTGERRRVSGLNLQGLSLEGSISPSIGTLSSLTSLYLQDNSLAGSLPDSIGSLSRLRALNASSNLIQGLIPLSITNCTSLTVLDLSANAFTGPIPSRNLHALKELQTLKLGHNQLTGTIPPSIGNLSSLITLDLGTNSIHGPIPDTIATRLRHLQNLDIPINNLTGTVPPSLYNLSSLVSFNLASNNLWGKLPADLGSRLPQLLHFHFCFNRFTGSIPPSLHNITNIQSLRMSNNLLTGTVPPGLEKLHNLTMYNIGFNLITDNVGFLASLTNSTSLGFLAIDENFLEGEIPDSVGNLSHSLSKFYMGGNRINGSIPASMGELTSLTLLNMSHNSLSGEIPPSLGGLEQLQMLVLAGNKIAGEIPTSLGSLTDLTGLRLNGNELEGRIPTSFRNYKNLESFDVSNNRLSGDIPREVISSLSSLSSLLNLSHNALTGPLPEEVGRLVNLIAIDVSGNQLTGEITNSIGNCKSLQSLDLSSNELSGDIPESLGQLRALQFLNLSYNDLEGALPDNGIFSNLSAHRIDLEGNRKLCQSPRCRFVHRSTHRTAIILITVLSAVLILISLLGILVLLFVRRSRRHAVMATNAVDHYVIKGQHRLVSYEELLRATGGFDVSNRIGAGSIGTVYKGVLIDGVEAAIKVLDLAVRGASKSFISECEALRNIRHRNLVGLITACSGIDHANRDFRALVYELMPNGSLEDWIRGKMRHVDGGVLNVVERLRVAIDVASAMDYLHTSCSDPVVHCDLKPSNVMLDEDMTAKVGDFGLARLLVEKPVGQDSTASTIGIKGSIGYIPPEYGYGGKPSVRGDVYSYGTLLLELLTGKSPTDGSFTEDLTLERWVRAAASTPFTTLLVLDAELLATAATMTDDQGRPISTESLHDCLVSMVGVGLLCAAESPEARISMGHALRQLNAIRDALMKKTVGGKR